MVHSKYMGKTEYYNVYSYFNKNKGAFYMAIYKKTRKDFKDIKEAAKWVDLQLILNNKPPKNILKTNVRK